MNRDEDEWRWAVDSMTETEHAATQTSLDMAAGVCGEPTDDLYG